MERVTSASVGALDLLAAPRTVMAFDLPDARLTDFGRSAQLSGAGRYVAHYADAPWSVQVKVEPSTDADVDATTAAFVAGALIGWDGATSRIVGVDITGDEDHGTMRLITYAGTREPAWRGASQTFSLSPASGSNKVALPTVGGTLAAEMDIEVMHTTSGTFSALGIKHAPMAGYAYYDGVGAFGADVALSTTPATIHAGTDIDVAANRGTHILVAFLKHTATTASTLVWRAGSAILTATKLSRPVRSAVANTTEFINLGLVSIPAAPLPAGAEGVVYGAEAAGSSYTPTGTTTAIGYGYGETFPHSGGEHTGVTLKLKNTTGAAHTLTVSLYSTTGTTPNTVPNTTSALVTATVTVPTSQDGTLRVTWNQVLASGTYAIWVRERVDNADVDSAILHYQDSAAGYASGNGITRLNGAWVAGRYAATATTITQNAYNTTTAVGPSTPLTQTFTATGRVQSVSVWYGAASTDSWLMLEAGSTVLAEQQVTSAGKQTISLDTSDYSGQTLTITCSEGNAGGIDSTVQRNTTSVYAGGSCSAGGDLRFEVTERVKSGFDAYFVAHRRSVTNFNAKTPITATCTQSGKTAAFYSCTRIPADIGAVVVQGAFSAGNGWLYDAASKSFFPADPNGVTGTALDPYSVGTLSPLPGENTLVLYGNGGATTITGTITDLRITRG